MQSDNDIGAFPAGERPLAAAAADGKAARAGGPRSIGAWPRAPIPDLTTGGSEEAIPDDWSDSSDCDLPWASSPERGRLTHNSPALLRLQRRAAGLVADEARAMSAGPEMATRRSAAAAVERRAVRKPSQPGPLVLRIASARGASPETGSDDEDDGLSNFGLSSEHRRKTPGRLNYGSMLLRGSQRVSPVIRISQEDVEDDDEDRSSFEDQGFVRNTAPAWISSTPIAYRGSAAIAEVFASEPRSRSSTPPRVCASRSEGAPARRPPLPRASPNAASIGGMWRTPSGESGARDTAGSAPAAPAARRGGVDRAMWRTAPEEAAAPAVAPAPPAPGRRGGVDRIKFRTAPVDGRDRNFNMSAPAAFEDGEAGASERPSLGASERPSLGSSGGHRRPWLSTVRDAAASIAGIVRRRPSWTSTASSRPSSAAAPMVRGVLPGADPASGGGAPQAPRRHGRRADSYLVSES